MAIVLLTACGGAAKSATASPTTTSAASTTSAGASRTTTSGTATGAINVRLPATFKILPGPRLSPPAVYVPAQIPIELILVSSVGRAHQVVLGTRPPRSLTVPPHTRAEKLVPALARGTYRLDVDGVPRGTLHIGAAPGA